MPPMKPFVSSDPRGALQQRLLDLDRERGDMDWPADAAVARSLRSTGGIFFCDMLTCAHERKTSEPGALVIEGYASTKNVDRYLTILNPKMWRSSVGYWRKHGVVLRNHDYRQPIAGAPHEATIDEEGLWVKWEMTPPLQPGDRFDYTRYEFLNGLLPGHSVGFMIYSTEDIELLPEDDPSGAQVKFNAGELLENSLVSIPANRESLADVARGLALGSRSAHFRAFTREISDMRRALGRAIKEVDDGEAGEDLILATAELAAQNERIRRAADRI